VDAIDAGNVNHGKRGASSIAPGMAFQQFGPAGDEILNQFAEGFAFRIPGETYRALLRVRPEIESFGTVIGCGFVQELKDGGALYELFFDDINNGKEAQITYVTLTATNFLDVREDLDKLADLRRMKLGHANNL
jgi:hypothetical protein